MAVPGLPTLSSPVTLEQALEVLHGNDLSTQVNYVLDPNASQSLPAHLRTIGHRKSVQNEQDAPGSNSYTTSVGLIIGPESGLDADEIDRAVKAGAQAVTIGPRILRTETAGPACIALVQAILGDLDQ